MITRAQAPAVSIVLCTHNRAEQLRRTLGTLFAVDTPPGVEWDVIVVDNNSSDATRQVVDACSRRTAPGVRYLFEPTQGISFARNAGVRAASGEVVAFIDDDVTIGAGWLTALYRAFQDGRCIGVGGRIRAGWSSPKPAWYADAGPYRLMKGIAEYEHGDDPVQVGPDRPPFGGNMAFRRRAFELHGLFRTDLGRVGSRRMGGEDTEYGRRLMAAGEAIMYAPDAVVTHPVEPFKLRKAFFRRYYYYYGRQLVRLDKERASIGSYFGVPRHLFRSLASHALRWAVALDPQQRFFHQLQCWQVVGSIVERRSGLSPAGPGNALSDRV